MSGPKVVRIVTLEEVKAICRRLMAQVDSGAGFDLLRLAERLGLTYGSIEASILARSGQLNEMFAAGRWMDLQSLPRIRCLSSKWSGSASRPRRRPKQRRPVSAAGGLPTGQGRLPRRFARQARPSRTTLRGSLPGRPEPTRNPWMTWSARSATRSRINQGCRRGPGESRGGSCRTPLRGRRARDPRRPVVDTSDGTEPSGTATGLAPRRTGCA